MEERSEGIVLRTRPLTDTSLVVEWLTPELGRISTVAKGARRPKSAFAGKLDLFYHAAFSFQRSLRSELHALREVQVLNAHARLRASYPLLHQAAYFTILLEQGTERETPLPELHALLTEYLRHLPANDTIPEAMFLFEYRFLDLLGFSPEFTHELFTKTFAHLAPIPRDDRNQLNRILKTSVATALERLPPQRQRAIEALRS